MNGSAGKKMLSLGDMEQKFDAARMYRGLLPRAATSISPQSPTRRVK